MDKRGSENVAAAPNSPLNYGLTRVPLGVLINGPNCVPNTLEVHE
jgi:hypothetical protein